MIPVDQTTVPLLQPVAVSDAIAPWQTEMLDGEITSVSGAMAETLKVVLPRSPLPSIAKAV